MSIQDCQRESVAQAANDHGYDLSDECITDIIEALAACEEYASYSHRDTGVLSEEAILRKELEREKSKQICRECNGTGGTRWYSASHTGIDRCHRCDGRGFIYP